MLLTKFPLTTTLSLKDPDILFKNVFSSELAFNWISLHSSTPDSVKDSIWHRRLLTQLFLMLKWTRFSTTETPKISHKLKKNSFETYSSPLSTESLTQPLSIKKNTGIFIERTALPFAVSMGRYPSVSPLSVQSWRSLKSRELTLIISTEYCSPFTC